MVPDRKKREISLRKQPKQVRSTQLLSDILTAAAQVLAKEGVHRFTTARVAEKAGVSIGSLYQYFPNKAALLFRLQTDEWDQTSAMLRTILEDRAKRPLQRLREAVHAFIRSEYEESDMRVALGHAEPLYGNTPEADRLRSKGRQMVRRFVEEMLPELSPSARVLPGGILEIFLESAGKSISEQCRSPREMEAYAGAVADMLCSYFERLGARK